MIYTSARWADEAQTMVIGWDADGNTETVPANFTIFRCPDDGPLGFVNNGGVIEPYVAPEPVVEPPHLNNGGLVRFSGGSPAMVHEAIRMLSVTRVAKGRYRAYHGSAMPSDQYSAIPSIMDANPRLARITARTADYVEVRVTDLAGAAQDATEVTVETQRVIYP
jgi:hypothetical protein